MDRNRESADMVMSRRTCLRCSRKEVAQNTDAMDKQSTSKRERRIFRGVNVTSYGIESTMENV